MLIMPVTANNGLWELLKFKRHIMYQNMNFDGRKGLNMKRAFFIIGPEGCGTYMLAEAFVSAGCTYCDQEDVDRYLAQEQPHEMTLRRSLPHAGVWPNIEQIAKQMEARFYEVNFLWIIREQYAAKRSVIARKPVYTAFEYEKAIQIIGNNLDRFGGRLISYEYFVLSPEYRQNIFSEFKLPPPEMEFYDGNRQYY